MTHADIEVAVRKALENIAPEISAAQLRPDVPLRDQVDIDSMDFLRFVIEVHTRLGVEIPESDYPRLATLADAVAYVESRM